MKTIIKIIAAIFLSVSNYLLNAQPNPWDVGVKTIEDAKLIGGGAPISGGILILICLGLGYGIKKIYDLRKSVSE